MRRVLCVAVLSLTALFVSAPVAMADPAVELPAAACNDGTAQARAVANANSNVPVLPHSIHGCHVHLPS